MDAVEDAVDEVHTLQEELQRKTAENAQLREKVHKQTDQLVRLQTNMKAMAQQKDEQRQLDTSRLQSWIESQTEEIRELKASLRDRDMALQGLGGLQFEKEELSKRVAEMSAAEVSAGQHSQALKAAFEKEVQRLEEERDRLEEENKALKESNPQSSDNLKQPRTRALSDDLLQENDELNRRVGQLEADNKDLRRQRDALKEAMASGTAAEQNARASPAAAPGSAVTRAKNIAQMVINSVREQRLHQRLDEEGERAQELEMRARDFEDQTTRLQRENIRLRQELDITRSSAQQERVMKYGAKQRVQDKDVKMVELQRQIEDLTGKLEESAFEEMQKLRDMKGNDAMMRSLYAEFKTPGFDFDGIDSDSSSGPELEADLDSFMVPVESGGASVSPVESVDGDGKGEVASLSDRSQPEAKAGSEAKADSSPVNPTAYKHYFDMYQPKEKAAAAILPGLNYAPPGGYQTKRERKIAKMAGSIVQQKLLKALHLIELLQRANNKLTEDMEDLEDAATMAQRMERWLLIVVTFMSLLVVGLGVGLMSIGNCKS